MEERLFANSETGREAPRGAVTGPPILAKTVKTCQNGQNLREEERKRERMSRS